MSGWVYEDHPDVDSVRVRTEELVGSSSEDAFCAFSYLLDTRPRHAFMFELVVPQGQEAYAGNYRGSAYPYLATYNVFFGRLGEQAADHNRGTFPALVATSMAQFHAKLAESLVLLRNLLASSERSDREKIVAIAHFVGIFFATFLAIHPYANGNGHISRLLVRSMFDVFGMTCRHWEVASRNPLPPDEFVARFRQGDRAPLILCFLEMVRLEAAPLH